MYQCTMCIFSLCIQQMLVRCRSTGSFLPSIWTSRSTSDIPGQDHSPSITAMDLINQSDRYGDPSIPSRSVYSNLPGDRADKLVNLDSETKLSQNACGRRPSCAHSLSTEVVAQAPCLKQPISDDDNTNPAEVPQAFEYYDIHNNGRKGYVIRPVVFGLPPWEELQQLKSIVHKVQYEIGDIVYIYLGNSDSDGIALIREIRDLGDGRAMICVLWYATFEDAVTYKCRNLHLWPRKHTHMVTNQLAVLMWDTANGKVTGDALRSLCHDKILDVCGTGRKIYNRQHRSFSWTTTY